MNKYRVLVSVTTNKNLAEMRGFLKETFADNDISPTAMVVKLHCKRGKKNPDRAKKIAIFLSRRTKPFSSQVFADYLGCSQSYAWRVLDREVAKGTVVKRYNGEGGKVEYRVFAPTKHD